jgi:hypothetical protein
MTKQIPLTKGRFALVDDEDFEYLVQFKWHACQARNVFYAKRRIGKRIPHTDLPMQNAIMGVPPGVQVDHKDHDGLNNTRENLRVCTNAENNCNKGKQSNNTSGYKGVHSLRGKWQAQIKSNGTKKYLGVFNTPEEAARAYDKVARELHGEFAYLNFKD